jgi:hypothetical protein
MYFFRQAGEPNFSFLPAPPGFFPLRLRELEREELLRRFLFRPPPFLPPYVAGGSPPPGAMIPCGVATPPPGITGLACRARTEGV